MLKIRNTLPLFIIAIVISLLSSTSTFAVAYLHEADFRTMADGQLSATNGSGSSDPYSFVDLSNYAPPGVAQPSFVTNGLLSLRPNLPASSSIGLTHGSTFPPVADGSYTSGRANLVVGGYFGEDTTDSTVSISMDSSNLTAPGGPFDYIGRFIRHYDGVTVVYEAKIMLRNGGFIDVASTFVPEIKAGDILSIEWDENGLVTLYINNIPILNYTVPVQDRFDTTSFNGVFFAMDSSGENPPVPSIQALSISAKGSAYHLPDLTENTGGEVSQNTVQDTVTSGKPKLAETGQQSYILLIISLTLISLGVWSVYKKPRSI